MWWKASHAKKGKAMSLFPIFLKLDDRPCLVVGAGTIGQGKIRSLITAGARVRVVAPHATATVGDWAHAGVITWEQRNFEASDLDGVVLVVAATNSTAVNEVIFREAHRRNILCNAVDDPERCDFYYPAVVRRGNLQVAISTAGHSPALAQRLRRELEAQFGSEYAGWLEQLGEMRRQLFASDIDPEDRRHLLHELSSRSGFESATGASLRGKEEIS
jgi:precorrin-2 dehydrogenase/sirohydrochlorin ferrochelatase